MTDFSVTAAKIGPTLADETAMLLSRAYTGERRVGRYTQEELERWRHDIGQARLGYSPMPADWLQRFPTMRNLARPPMAREESQHFYSRTGTTLAGHVSVFPREFSVAGGPPFPVAFLEDVATHPQHEGEGLGSRLVEAASRWAKLNGYGLCGLSTGIPQFYERLGWVSWRGRVHYTGPDGALVGPWRAMVIALNDEAESQLKEWLDQPLNAGLRGG
ncbi:MAG: GNAT family N-acetyltransferase [Dehalococcoidia bacterium]